MLQKAIQLRFGVVPAEIQEQLEGLSVEQLEDLMESVMAQSLEELTQKVVAIAPPPPTTKPEANPLKSGSLPDEWAIK